MSLSYEIRESATSVAKKYDHGELTKLHILYGIRRKFPEQLKSLSLERIEKEISTLPRVPSNLLVVSEEVEELLSKIQYPQQALELATSLSLALLGVGVEDSLSISEPSPIVEEEELTLSQSLERLNKLIGLNEVKTQVSKLINSIRQITLDQVRGYPKFQSDCTVSLLVAPALGRRQLHVI